MSEGYEIINEVMCFNGKPCQLEFGNKYQINVLRKHELMMKELTTIGQDIDPEYEIKFNFKCICGRQLSHDEDIDSSENVEYYEPSKRCTCSKCNRQYRFEIGGACTNYKVLFIGYKKEDDYD